VGSASQREGIQKRAFNTDGKGPLGSEGENVCEREGIGADRSAPQNSERERKREESGG
jgi:hypothetical protein